MHHGPARLVCLLALALILSGCSLAGIRQSGDSARSCLTLLSPPAPVTGLFVAPDDRQAPILDELDSASCTIDVSIYLLTADPVIDALARAADRGVEVRVILEEHPFGGGRNQGETRAELESHEIEVQWSGSEFRFSHAKFIVVDRQVALIMNQNLTASAFVSNREFGVVTTDTEAVAQAQSIFDVDWNGSGETLDGPLIVSPDTSRERLLELINGASGSIAFYAEVIRDVEIVESLVRAEARGVAVRLIVDVSIDDSSADALLVLGDAGVEIRYASFLYIHAKVMIVDGTAAVVGSQNYTMTSLDDNRELAMVVTNPLLLARCAAVFERDWARSVPVDSGLTWVPGAFTSPYLGIPVMSAPPDGTDPGATSPGFGFNVANSIVGPPRGSVDAALAFARLHGADRIDDVERYLEEIYRLAPTLGLDPAILVAQSVLETDTWRSDWWNERLNPAGIGITGDPAQEAQSATFESGTEAARAQMAHMHVAVYGAMRPLPPALQGVDPRRQGVFDAGWAGTVRTIADLAGKWAVDPDYAGKIVVRARAIFP